MNYKLIQLACKGNAIKTYNRLQSLVVRARQQSSGEDVHWWTCKPAGPANSVDRFTQVNSLLLYSRYCAKWHAFNDDYEPTRTVTY